MKYAQRLKIFVFAMMLLLPLAAQAQELTAVPPDGAAPPPPAYTDAQLDQMTAPIALYPDALVGQILMASTYPLEIVEADRWLQTPGNAQLSGPALQDALDQMPWDPSVKSLVAFPQVLSMLDKNLQWTEQLGDAFLAQQPAVMDSVQRLRAQAQAAGNLQSNQQQIVSGPPGSIIIEPANPQVVYVPTYNPQVVYGTWLYPSYPPYYFVYPPNYVYTTVGLIGFSTGIIVADWFWGWNHWDWHRHRIDIDDRRFVALNRGRTAHFSDDVWEHNPHHRHGVPYAPAVRAQFQPQSDEARRNFRGYAPRTTSPAIERPAAQTQRPVTTPNNFRRRPVSGGRENVNGTRPAPQPRVQAPAGQRREFAPSRAQPVQTQRRSAPVYESFSPGSEVREQSQRGAYSRASRPAMPSRPVMHQQAPARAAPMARPAPSGSGQRGGNQRGGDNRSGGHDDHDRNH